MDHSYYCKISPLSITSTNALKLCKRKDKSSREQEAQNDHMIAAKSSGRRRNRCDSLKKVYHCRISAQLPTGSVQTHGSRSCHTLANSHTKKTSRDEILSQLERLSREALDHIVNHSCHSHGSVEKKITQLQSAILKANKSAKVSHAAPSINRNYKLELNDADIQRISELCPPDTFRLSSESTVERSHIKLIRPVLSDCTFTDGNTLRSITNYCVQLAG